MIQVKQVMLTNCNPVPNRVVLKRRSSDDKTVRWVTQEMAVVYTLTLPGGVFEGYPDEFQVTVTRDSPSPDLTLLPDASEGGHPYGIEREPECREKTRLTPPTIMVED